VAILITDPDPDSIATPVRRALAEVCTVPMLLVLTDIIGYNMLKLYLKIYTSKNEILGAPLVI